MPRLHLYVSEEVAKQLRAQARVREMSLSEYLAEVVQRDLQAGWPDGYFDEVVGGWIGEGPNRPEPLELEER